MLNGNRKCKESCPLIRSHVILKMPSRCSQLEQRPRVLKGRELGALLYFSLLILIYFFSFLDLLLNPEMHVNPTREAKVRT